MDEDTNKTHHQVEQIGFKIIPEDGFNDQRPPIGHFEAAGYQQQQYGYKQAEAGLQQVDLRGKRKKNDNKLQKTMPNFTFEYSYPAVIFENVCFRIDKTQQQANFLNECLFKLKTCVRPSTDASRQKVDILKSINLSVPYGSIFGLLGPSSCGKTTLLRCLVGLLKPNSGNIRLFCHSSESQSEDDDGRSGGCWPTRRQLAGDRQQRGAECKVPGSNVGYMPQDLGLYEDFTIRQLLTMFGQYMKMESKLIKSRIEFMGKFLDLPSVDREIGSLSGGQKRRVSFAIACLHMPPLIILDEPTVGVDPLLRKSIWKYLRRLADEENKTIIITTHYIEEAAQADQIALMRAGEILVQDTPAKIMESNDCRTLEEAFLKICNNVHRRQEAEAEGEQLNAEQRYKLYPQPRFNWHDKLRKSDSFEREEMSIRNRPFKLAQNDGLVLRQLDKLKALDGPIRLTGEVKDGVIIDKQQHDVRLVGQVNKLSMEPNIVSEINSSLEKKIQSLDSAKLWKTPANLLFNDNNNSNSIQATERNERVKSFRGQKLIINQKPDNKDYRKGSDNFMQGNGIGLSIEDNLSGSRKSLRRRIEKSFILIWALLYKNYRRNVNSLPLLAFQFMLPVIQMISFSLCVGGRPTNIGLGLVNHDQLAPGSHLLMANVLVNNNNNNGSSIIGNNSSVGSLNLLDTTGNNSTIDEYLPMSVDDLMSTRYLSYVDQSMISIRPYRNLRDALNDVRKAKLWAVMEISENFTSSILRRFDLENFYQLDVATIKQSVIKLYPDRSNKVLDMICHRSLVNSYRQFLLDEFEHFKRLPIEIKEPIFSIKPNLISNSIDGYTESIAAGLLASLTYIMAAGLTTFIMVVERSAGILERTFTSGINPVAYLMAHAIFRSFVMMLQIAVVMFLTFYLLEQPMVGSIWLAYLMLMTLNLTGISYGLLISSIVTDQNGAALTIVSSLVVKITMSGILWPFEAIPRWLRTICYIQPLTMPIQALKAITLKGSGIEDKAVYLGFMVSVAWLTLFLIISAKRFKFYQY